MAFKLLIDYHNRLKRINNFINKKEKMSIYLISLMIIVEVQFKLGRF